MSKLGQAEHQTGRILDLIQRSGGSRGGPERCVVVQVAEDKALGQLPGKQWKLNALL